LEEKALLRTVAQKLLVKLDSMVEQVEPQTASTQALRQIAATLKDIRDIQVPKVEEQKPVTVVLEGQTELFGR